MAPQTSTLPTAANYPPSHSEGLSWDVLSGLKKDYEAFDPRNAKEAYLVYADGDVPKNKLVKFYHFLLNLSVITRWFLFIVPVLGILWIPGIFQLTIFPNAKVWGVNLLWWSIWLSVVWGGWWASLAASYLLHATAKATILVVMVESRRYVDWMQYIHRYIALAAWTIAIWVSWTPLIAYRQDPSVGDRSVRAVGLVGRVLFAFVICAAILLCEKVMIQWIAEKFHERSYANRIANQKFAIHTLVTLYRNSFDIPGRSDTLNAGHQANPSIDAKVFLKRVRHGVRSVATTVTTALGAVASEMAGSSILQPNSPLAMVKTALESANKSRLLARRLFYSFKKPAAAYLYPNDITQFFPSPEEAKQAFTLFDKNENGDISRDELEMTCLEVHREQLSLHHSMLDLDSAVGKLDNILMTLYYLVVLVFLAVALEAQLATLVTGTGTLVLGLSWLFGASMQEILGSMIFLFIKHPYDVGDRVHINSSYYTVQEINLLSTVFLDSNLALVQAPNNILNTLWIQNIRRSREMSESFTFNVAYATTFSDLEKLREKMLEFLAEEKRDYEHVFDLTVSDFPDQTMMTLVATIKYKSNWQQEALRVMRRNKWLCALRTALAEIKMFGPKGDPNALPATTRYTEVPWELIKEEDERTAAQMKASVEHGSFLQGEWQLSDRHTAMLDSADEVFGEAEMVR
ncbi:hypothetical protein M378DRAFT_186034 [Amanita muscaria Koide BX008]|uniref:Mechanosensitive ion channel protein n=1 Tax=Amanita muscaria (strain Koide BX008) TaxID=946122 RepID=A0A0C2SSA7_AMAMK|nr:hypothetical protein M378DRAFT_186034 [Amanita muscaria Koide BX008]